MELEYDHAVKLKKPVFCYIVDEEHPWPPKMIKDEAGKSKLQKFKKKLGEASVRDVFTTPQDLAYKIATFIGRFLSFNSSKGMVSLNLSVLKNETDFLDDNEMLVNYEITRQNFSSSEGEDYTMNIRPQSPYLQKIAEGGLIKASSFKWQPFGWDFPTLDIKVVNNTDKTIFLREAVFDIEDSVPDPAPVLVIKEDTLHTNALHFRLVIHV